MNDTDWLRWAETIRAKAWNKPKRVTAPKSRRDEGVPIASHTSIPVEVRRAESPRQ